MTAPPVPLRIRVLGELQVEVDGRAWTPPASRPAQALLGYLALEPGPHRRHEVAAALWPDVLDASARGSLRSAIWALRRALGRGAEDRLIATRAELGIVDDPMLWVDLRAFKDALRDGRPDAALELRRGALLEGFEDEWAVHARDTFDTLAGEATAALVDAALERGDCETAIRWSRRRANEAPYDEAATRMLMTALSAAGEHAAALEAYRRLADRLRRDLAVAPATATRRLAESLRAPGRHRAAPAAPLIGRDAELRRLDTARRCLTSRQLGVATISGEPGIGKTTLARELLRRAAEDGARVAAGVGSPIGEPAPYAQWAELLRDLDAVLADASSSDVNGPPELRRARLRENAVDVVDRAADDRGIALLLDDAHGADAFSLELLAYVARRLRDRPVLLVLTRRHHPRSPAVDGLIGSLGAIARDAVSLDLGPLAPPRIAEILRASTGADARGVQRAVALADGNPLLALEAARSLERGEDPAAGLRAIVRAAIGRLSPDARDVAELAAIAGGRLSGPQLVELNATHAAERALRSGLLVTDGAGIRFRHGLLHEAVLREILPPRRPLLHERAAELATEPAERVHHLRHAGRDELAAAALAEAAERALAVGAVDEAAALLHEAIGIDHRDPSLRLRLARTEAWRGNGPAADAQLARALDLHDPRDSAALGRLWLEAAQWYRSSLCDPRRTREAAEQALRRLDGESESRAEALAAYAWSQALLGELDAAERHVAAAARLDARGRLTFDLALVRAHALAIRGDVAASLEAFQDAAAALRPAGRPDLAYSVWMHAAAVAAFGADLARSLRYVDRCLEDVGRLTYLRVHALAARGYVLARLGRHDEARSAADRQLILATSANDPALLAVADHDAGMIALAGGRHRAAVAHLTVALAAGARVSRATALLARAEAHARLGYADDAEADLRAVALIPLRPADAPHALVPRLTWIQGLVAKARGDELLCRRRLDEAANGWRRLLADGHQGPMHAWVANIVDLGRPPAAGLVEPSRELERTLADLEATVMETAG
jgi:DNA-binding SARP family transcriptional activator